MDKAESLKKTGGRLKPFIKVGEKISIIKLKMWIKNNIGRSSICIIMVFLSSREENHYNANRGVFSLSGILSYY